MTVLSQGSLLVLIIGSAVGLLDQSRFLATCRPAGPVKNEEVKLGPKTIRWGFSLFSKWHFYEFVCDVISCIKMWCLQQCAACQVNFLSNATKCVAHRNWVRMVVLVWRRTESSCWVMGGGAEDSREKVQLGDNNNKYESESEWSEQCLKPKNFHNSVLGERMYPCLSAGTAQ